MRKLIDAFTQNPTDDNAALLTLYILEHPMCRALTPEDAKIYKVARDQYWHISHAQGC